MKISLKDHMRHVLNPLHVYCTLSCVVRKERALRAARVYERYIFRSLFSFVL